MVPYHPTSLKPGDTFTIFDITYFVDNEGQIKVLQNELEDLEEWEVPMQEDEEETGNMSTNFEESNESGMSAESESSSDESDESGASSDGSSSDTSDASSRSAPSFHFSSPSSSPDSVDQPKELKTLSGTYLNQSILTTPHNNENSVAKGYWQPMLVWVPLPHILLPSVENELKANAHLFNPIFPAPITEPQQHRELPRPVPVYTELSTSPAVHRPQNQISPSNFCLGDL